MPKASSLRSSREQKSQDKHWRDRQEITESHILSEQNPSDEQLDFEIKITIFSSVQFSHSVMSDSLQPHESQHARPPCPSPTPGVHSDSRPSSQ